MFLPDFMQLKFIVEKTKSQQPIDLDMSTPTSKPTQK
jgi:hypothetical protein